FFQGSHRLSRFEPAHLGEVGAMEPCRRQTSEQHSFECLLRQELCRGDQAVRLSVGVLEISRSEARRIMWRQEYWRNGVLSSLNPSLHYSISKSLSRPSPLDSSPLPAALRSLARPYNSQ